MEAAELLVAAIQDNGNVVGFVTGKASSMAIPVVAACKRCVALAGTTFFFHSLGQGRVKATDFMDCSKHEALKEEMVGMQTRYADRILEGLARRKSKPQKLLTREVIFAWCVEERELTAHEAREWGLVDDVLTMSQLLRIELLLGKPENS